MEIMKNWMLLFVVGCFLVGCTPEGRMYEKHKELSPNLEWLKADKREFQVPIENNNLSYKLSLTFRYATGYQFRTANVQVTEISPAGNEQVNEYTLTVRNENGEYIGEPGYDIWDSEHLVEANKTYSETGTYTYRITHIMPQDPLNFAMEIGMILDEVK
jgi:gliding motility-associated lipoprotein GldH